MVLCVQRKITFDKAILIVKVLDLRQRKTSEDTCWSGIFDWVQSSRLRHLVAKFFLKSFILELTYISFTDVFN